MKNDKTHSILLILVAGYLCYIAYHLWKNMQEGADEMSQGMYILLIAAFALAGIAVLCYAGMILRKARRREKEERQGEEEVDDQSS